MRIINKKQKKFTGGTRSEVEKVCLNCGKPYLTVFKTQKYCSTRCYEQYKSKNKIGRVCRKCGKRFSVQWQSHLTTCPTCRGKDRKLKKSPEKTECLNCGKTFRPFEIRCDAKGIHPAGLEFCCIQCLEAYERKTGHEYNP